MKYIAILLLIIAGMFYYGDRLSNSLELTYSSPAGVPHTVTYTKKEYCSPEIEEEVTKYKTQLDAAYSRIYQLNSKLEEAKSATLSASVDTKEEQVQEETGEESQTL